MGTHNYTKPIFSIYSGHQMLRRKKTLHCYTEIINYCLQSCHALSSLNRVVVPHLVQSSGVGLLEAMSPFTFKPDLSVCFPDFNVAEEIDIVIECCCFRNISSEVQSHSGGD